MQIQSLYILSLAGLSSALTTACTTGTSSLCQDFFKTCGTPTPTAILTYGGCHDECVKVTYSPPPCPGTTTTSSCTSTGTTCQDFLKTCGSPTPTATLTYGGCHNVCSGATYTIPPCPTTTNF
ncbi:hypothetical protein F5Y16DRAFT_372355 [Xylariaceae sp. FL0255]|nr:hypothetical protein F5Y16DRAFT_372355 [Xylariaceae sp. FL0255]